MLAVIGEDSALDAAGERDFETVDVHFLHFRIDQLARLQVRERQTDFLTAPERLVLVDEERTPQHHGAGDYLVDSQHDEAADLEAFLLLALEKRLRAILESNALLAIYVEVNRVESEPHRDLCVGREGVQFVWSFEIHI